jgi:hypothetical protein
MRGDQKMSLDELIEEFDLKLSQKDTGPKHKRDIISFWLPDIYKHKYEALQIESKRNFGKLCSTILKKIIDDKYNELTKSSDKAS